jgi:hypothetical protein
MISPKFPTAQTGKTKVSPLSSNQTFLVACTNLNELEKNELTNFFLEMRGRFGRFQFESKSASFSMCRFDNDSAPFAEGQGPYSLIFRMKVLRP